VPRRIGLFIAIVQSILILAHLFVYETWVAFHPAASAQEILQLRVATIVLSFIFIAASLLAWRVNNVPVRIFYTLAAVWLGFLDLFFMAAFVCWIAYAIVYAARLPVSQSQIANTVFGLALLAGVYAIVNASWTRVHRITVKLPNLPDAWRGRVAALVSDMHLGHVRNVGFMRRVVHMLQRVKPDIVFVTGDMYDGTMVDVDKVAQPWSEFAAPLGTYFVLGNHEEFTGHDKYLRAVQRVGLRVLDSQKIDIDGLQIIGIHFIDAANPARFRASLQGAALDPTRPSILLSHAPDHLAIPEEEGVSLQLSGHTHGGQFPPFSWMTTRVYGKYVHGLQLFGKMQVFTNWGAGTWGPPMRLGTQSEIVLIKFE
jgi:predicted MPP superfamily phosphohydrolase